MPTETLPPILDATCGSRMIWFDKHCPAALYMDRREIDGKRIWKSSAKNGFSERRLDIHPDIVADFTAMPFPDGAFHLVVFDPPHLKHGGGKSWIVQKYGLLDKNWPTVLRDGYRECMRVLAPHGVLVFKWSEVQIRVGLVWEAMGATPLFGTRVGKNAGTIWAVFMKGVSRIPDRAAKLARGETTTKPNPNDQ